MTTVNKTFRAVKVGCFTLLFGWAAVVLLLTQLPSLAQGSTTRASAASVCDDVAPDDDGIPVGESQRVGPLLVTITETEWVPLIDDFWSDGYLRVDFEVVNEGDEPVVHRGYYNLTLLDLEPGGTSPAHYDDEALMSDVELAPGEGVAGHVTFPVGYVDGTYRLAYQVDGFFDRGEVGYWSVDVEAGPNPAPTDRVVPTPTYTPGTEAVRDYDIDIEVEPDGDVRFTETIDYDFSNQLRHGIYRDLIVRQACSDRYERLYPLEVLSVSSPSGAPSQYVVESEGAMDRIKIGDPDRTITGVQTYVVEYRIEGALNGFDDHDELYWNVVGDQWAISLYDIDVAVSVPGGVDQVACFAGERGSRAPCSEARLDDGVADVRQDQLWPYNGLTIAVAFPKGVVPEPTAVLEEQWSLARSFSITPLTGIGFLVLTALVVGGYVVLHRRVGADLQAVGSPTDVAFAPIGTPGAPAPFFGDDHSPVEFAPPDGIRPAQMSVLMHERARPADISATIVDLAVRGYLSIEERRGGTDYRLELRGKDTGELLDYELAVLHALFGNRTEIDLSELTYKFSGKMRTLIDGLYDDAVNRGWFETRPDRVRSRWRARGIVLTIVSFFFLLIAVVFSKLALLVVPLVLAGLLLTFGAGAMPRRTAAGTGLLRRCRGFQQFIADSEAPRARWAEQRNIFSEYLPYAIVLGEADRWAATFESLGEDAFGGDTWYHGERPFSPVYLSSSINRFTSTSASTFVSVAPSTSGSSGSTGFSSSSSFSSGGSSGGGGGGGGGGSW